MMTLAARLKTARLQATADTLAGGDLTLYTAPQPAALAEVTTQTALAILAVPAGLTATDDGLSIGFVPTPILVEGEAAWGRMTDVNGDALLDGDAGLVASTALFRLKSTSLIAGGDLTTVIATFTES